MKQLVVDVGNTSTAVGIWQDGRVSRVRHFDGADHGERFAKFRRLGGTSFSEIKEVAYVSVVPKADRLYKDFLTAAGMKVHQISYRDFAAGNKRRAAGLQNIRLDYARPETIGADRLCDAVASVKRYGAPVLVMDFGTALTAAIVTGDHRWRGGVIAPGFPLMRDYLFERTAKLPRMKMGSARAPKIGRSTEEAMRFGALVGYRGMVREIVRTLKQNFSTDFKLVATGGFARWVLADSDLDFTIDPTLTLFGAGEISRVVKAGRESE